MHYRLEADGRFTLYSVGWNGLDDAGLVAAGSADGAQGDWVWDANPGS
jgi:hypothetical protein